MRTIIFCFMMTAIFPAYSQDGTVSEFERTFLIDYLERTQSDMLELVTSLDEKTWSTKPSDGGWSVGEIVEHITSAENAVFGSIQEALAAPAQDMNLRKNDAWLLSKVNDRGVKVSTPLPTQESNKSKEEVLKEYKNTRAETLKFLSNDELPLRNHFGKALYGSADAYQLFLIIGGHNMRHTAQITETLDEFTNLQATQE
ncbi:MAG: DinB family protein [Bacteroidota bacterium]